jgi:hypothetical protein
MALVSFAIRAAVAVVAAAAATAAVTAAVAAAAVAVAAAALAGRWRRWPFRAGRRLPTVVVWWRGWCAQCRWWRCRRGRVVRGAPVVCLGRVIDDVLHERERFGGDGHFS